MSIHHEVSLPTTFNPSITKNSRILKAKVSITKSLNPRFAIFPSRCTHDFTKMSMHDEVFQPTPSYPSIHHEVLTNLFGLSRYSDVGYWWIQNSPPCSITIRSNRSDKERRSGPRLLQKTPHAHDQKNFPAQKRGEQENNTTKCTKLLKPTKRRQRTKSCKSHCVGPVCVFLDMSTPLNPVLCYIHPFV